MSYYWIIRYAQQAQDDWCEVKNSHGESVCNRVRTLIEIIKKDPFGEPPPYRRLGGELEGSYARWITATHRLVYEIIEPHKTVKVLALVDYCSE